MQRRLRHRGISILWTCILLVVLVGFCSLSVDMARLQLARTELQRATIAAARAGAAGLAVDRATARSYARTVAGQNRYDLDKALSLGTGEIAFITQGGKEGVRVSVTRQVPLLLAGIFNKTSGNVSASAAAVYTPGNSAWRYVVAAHDSINMSGNILVDGYDSGKGPYGGSNTSYADLAAGRSGNFNGNLDINGTVYYGGTRPTASGNRSVNFVSPLPQPIPSALPPLPASYTHLGNYSGNNNITLAAGNYYVTDLNISGNTTITASGDITIYSAGNINISGGLKASGGKPLKIQIVMLSPAGVHLRGNSTIQAVILAPNSPVNISGRTNFHGSIICKSAVLSGNIKLHYDTSLGSGDGAGGGITLVE